MLYSKINILTPQQHVCFNKYGVLCILSLGDLISCNNKKKKFDNKP